MPASLLAAEHPHREDFCKMAILLARWLIVHGYTLENLLHLFQEAEA
jgi:hypothetical protein